MFPDIFDASPFGIVTDINENSLVADERPQHKRLRTLPAPLLHAVVWGEGGGPGVTFECLLSFFFP